MKKTLGFIFLLILSFSLFGYSSIVTNLHSNEINLLDNNSTGISVSYEMGRIEGEIITTKDGEYLQLSSEEYSLTGFVGEPQLPYSQKIIAVPLEAKVIINTKIISKEVITLTSLGFDNQIAPAQRSVAKCEDYSKIPFDKDVKIYNSSNYYSHISADVNEIGIFRGLRLFEVNYYPVSYSPSKNEITVINEAEVTVEFVGGNSIATQNLREKTRSRAFEGIYKSYVFNYQNTRSTLEQYPLGYVIVTPTNFLDTLEPFINWKKEQGYDVTILTTTVTGTTTTGIKNHIDNLWDNATPEAPAPSYLLIVGDTPQVPAYVGETGTGEPHVTDLNYVKMEGNDYLPEMYYGRFSATTTSQLANQVNKTLLYQKFEMSDPSYLNRATLIAGVDADYAPTHGNGTIYYGAENYFNSDHGLDVNAYYYPESGTSESSIYADINAGVGYLNYTAHGSQTSWADPSMSITNVNNFTNDEMYPVVVGNCCLTNHFDTPTCFGEAWLRAENGAVIYIGGTNNTLWNEDYWWSVGHFTPTNTAEPTYEDTDLGMFDALFHDNSESFVDWANSAGAMVFRGNMAVQASSSSSKNYYWEIYSIMGDPSLMPRIGVPATQNASYAGSILMGASSLEVTAAPYSYVSLTQDGEIIGTQLLNSSGFGTVSFNALNTPTAVKIVISHTDYRPHISTIAVLPANVAFLTVSSYTVNDGANNLIEYGESCTLNLEIENIGASNAPSGVITFSENDSYISIQNNSANVSALTSGNSQFINNVIDFTVAQDVPDQHEFTLNYSIASGGENYTGSIVLLANSYVIDILSMTIDDSNSGNGNGVIDINEEFTIEVVVENIGHAASPMGQITYAATDGITFVNNQAIVPALSLASPTTLTKVATSPLGIIAGEEVSITATTSHVNGTDTLTEEFIIALLEIGYGTETSTHLPIEAYYGYTYSQSIYTATELGLGQCYIDKISYQWNGGNDFTDDIVLYMGNTTKNYFTTSSNWITLNNLTEVYNGPFTVTASSGWIEIDLDTPFLFNGTGNLVVGFDENTDGYHGSSDEFLGYNTTSNRSIYYYNDSTNPNPASPVSGNLIMKNPNIRLMTSSAVSTPNLVIDVVSLDFGSVPVGQSMTKQVTLANDGGETLTGTITLPNAFTFGSRRGSKDVRSTRTVSQNFSLASGEFQIFDIVFAPTTTVCYDSNIAIAHNASQNEAYVSLVACGVAAEFSIDRNSVVTNMFINQTSSETLTITNSGLADLEVALGLVDPNRASGGPDEYGYSWSDSNSDVTYNWIEISTSGTVISQGDDTSNALDLPYTFNFYGDDYSSVNVCSNGFLSFTSTSNAYGNTTIPNNSTPNCLIAPFWDDLTPTGGEWGNIYYQHFETYTVIQWENVSHYSGSDPLNSETFQVILYANSDIKLQYKTISAPNSATIGIENSTGTDGLLLSYNSSAYVEDNLAVLFTTNILDEWVTLETTDLTLAPNTSFGVVLNFNTTGYTEDTYNKNLYMITNDPYNQEVTIPISLTIGAPILPAIEVNTNVIDFGTVVMGDVLAETLTITNSGGGTLSGNITTTGGFTLTEASRSNFPSKNSLNSLYSKSIRNENYSVIAGASISYIVSRNTSIAAEYSGNITITSNDANNGTTNISVSVIIANPPAISIDSSTLEFTVEPTFQDSTMLLLSNTGDMDLTGTISIEYTQTRDIINIFEANFDDHDLENWAITHLYSPDHTWHIADTYSGNTLDGSSFLFIDSDGAGNNALDDIIETPLFDVSNYSTFTIEFDHYFNKYSGEYGNVDLWTGSEWINLAQYTGVDIGAWSNPSHETLTVDNNGYTDVKLRFHYYDANYDWYWAIDNLTVSGDGTPQPQWIITSNQLNSFTINPNNSEELWVKVDALDLPEGTYNGTVNISSNDSNNSNIQIPVVMNIETNVIVELNSPEDINIQTNAGNISLSWSSVENATSYKVYSSTDLSNWTEIDEVTETTCSINLPRSEKNFYKVKAHCD